MSLVSILVSLPLSVGVCDSFFGANQPIVTTAAEASAAASHIHTQQKKNFYKCETNISYSKYNLEKFSKKPFYVQKIKQIVVDGVYRWEKQRVRALETKICFASML